MNYEKITYLPPVNIVKTYYDDKYQEIFIYLKDKKEKRKYVYEEVNENVKRHKHK